MTENLRFLGLDVHAETIAVAVCESNGEVRSLGTLEWVNSLRNRAALIALLIDLRAGSADAAPRQNSYSIRDSRKLRARTSGRSPRCTYILRALQLQVSSARGSLCLPHIISF
jgi:hypothetical protein